MTTAGTPLNSTWLFPAVGSKFVPEIVTVVTPADPAAGVNPVIVTSPLVVVVPVVVVPTPASTVKLCELIAVPPSAVTLIGPVVAPLGTVTARKLVVA